MVFHHSLALQELLKRVPSIPDNRAHHCHAPLNVSSSNGRLYLRAQAAWEIPEGSDCGVGGKRRVRTTSLPIGIQRPTPLRFRNDAFSSVSSKKSDPSLRRNIIGVLVLGWLYIFSAEMVERGLQENSTLAYTDSRAELTTSNEVHDAIDIGDIDEDAATWWSAITSSNPGWKAIICHDGKNVFLSPWSVAMDGEQKLKIRREKNTNTAVPSSSPSSRRALQFLIDFCALYDIQSQLLAALAVATSGSLLFSLDRLSAVIYRHSRFRTIRQIH